MICTYFDPKREGVQFLQIAKIISSEFKGKSKSEKGVEGVFCFRDMPGFFKMLAHSDYMINSSPVEISVSRL